MTARVVLRGPCLIDTGDLFRGPWAAQAGALDSPTTSSGLFDFPAASHHHMHSRADAITILIWRSIKQSPRKYDRKRERFAWSIGQLDLTKALSHCAESTARVTRLQSRVTRDGNLFACPKINVFSFCLNFNFFLCTGYHTWDIVRLENATKVSLKYPKDPTMVNLKNRLTSTTCLTPYHGTKFSTKLVLE